MLFLSLNQQSEVQVRR